MNLPQTKRREQQNNSPFSRTIDKYNMEVLLPLCHNIGPPPFVHETDVTSSAPRQISIIHQLILIRRFPSDSASIHSLLLLCLFCTNITTSHVLFTCGSNSMCFSGLQITSRFFFFSHIPNIPTRRIAHVPVAIAILDEIFLFYVQTSMTFHKSGV